MTMLNISKLSFYVLLLSVAFAQILAVSAAENNLESDGVDDGHDVDFWSLNTAGRLKVNAKKDVLVHRHIAGDGDIGGRRCVRAYGIVCLYWMYHTPPVTLFITHAQWFWSVHSAVLFWCFHDLAGLRLQLRSEACHIKNKKHMYEGSSENSLEFIVHTTFNSRSFSPDHKQIFETSSNNYIRLVQNTFFYCFDLHGQMETVEAR